MSQRDTEVLNYLRLFDPLSTGEGAAAKFHAVMHCLIVPEAGNVAFVRWLNETERAFVIIHTDGGWPLIITTKANHADFREAGGTIVPHRFTQDGAA